MLSNPFRPSWAHVGGPGAAAAVVAVALFAVRPVRADVLDCPNAPLVPPPEGVCEVSAGDANRLIRATLVTPDRVLRNAHLLVGADGTITCAA
jgi:hypothetical protein